MNGSLEIKTITAPPSRKYPMYVAYDIDLDLINNELQLRLEQARAILLLFDTHPDVEDVPDYQVIEKFCRINPPLYIGNYYKEDHTEIAKQLADQIAHQSGQFNSEFGIEHEHEILDLKDLPLLN